jgi:hypothetical protein
MRVEADIERTINTRALLVDEKETREQRKGKRKIERNKWEK